MCDTMSSAKMSMPQTKGLLNMPGQNNCFLNSAVQVLWHLDVFRRSFRELSGHACMGHDSCIFCALKELFTQFQYSQESALPPDSLRRALAETFSDQRRFQLGFMDDAAECFENMLLRLHCHLAPHESEDRCTTAHCIPHEKFAMHLVEQLICTACGATSDPLPFTQMVHYVSTPALCHQAKHYYENVSRVSFGELLKSAGSLGDIRDCPKSCGARIHIKKTLYNRPDIVSIGLVWDSERPSITHIADVFKVIGTSLRIQDVFDDQLNGSKAGIYNNKPLSQKASSFLQLVGLVTYYGKHFSTFFYHSKLAAWIYFDDATVREIGPHWEQVVEKCMRGHFQPLLLLYTNPNGTPVDTTTAPKSITMIAKSSSQSHNSSSAAIKRNLSYIPKKNVPLKPLRSLNNNNNNPPPLRPMRHLLTNQMRSYVSRPGSVDDLLNNYTSASEDVPDSPLTKSSTSSAYFSDIGEIDSNYISRQTVENILHMRQQNRQQRQQRSSSSSIESFVDINAKTMKLMEDKMTTSNKVCSLQRRDSGNSSNSSAGSNSSSSGSSVTSENPYFRFALPVQRPVPFQNLPQAFRYPTTNVKDRNFIGSDCGYDSFSLSSSDSYPATGVPSSPIKHNAMQQPPRLSQIPEDVQFMELLNNSNVQDCDKLCSEADLLLLKSHEKEREGDIRTAAILSDSAAQKARSAMDAPYSNPQALISAKMKHSMCVMRSASLHRRVKEAEAEEKRRMKAEAMENHHSRQGSRDSNSGKHSRQNSKDGTLRETNTKKELEQQTTKTVELYATLPKKNAKKKLIESQITSSASLRLKEREPEKRSSIPSILDSLRNSRKLEKQMKEMKSDVESVCSSHVSSSKRMPLKSPPKEVEYSDYYSEFEGVKSGKISVHKSNSGSASCRENDSEYYAEFDILNSNKKQSRVRRKLLIGGFMKRKNRSLPDLREGSNQDTNEQDIKAMDDCGAKSVAQVSRKGFHKIHGLTDQGIYQRSSLVKVSTPFVDRKVNNQQNVAEKQTKLHSPNDVRLTNVTTSELQQLTPPPPPEAVPLHKSSASPSFGIEPNDELPPPPDDFLLDLRETRKQQTMDTVDCSMERLLSSNIALTKCVLSQPTTCTSSSSSTVSHTLDEIPKLGPLKCIQKLDAALSAARLGQSNLFKTENVSKSVKDLTSRFERMATNGPIDVNSANSTVPECQQTTETHPLQLSISSSSCPSTSSATSLNVSKATSISHFRTNSSSNGLRVVALLGTNLRYGQETANSGQSTQVPSPSPVPPSPTVPAMLMSAGNYSNGGRPERPPDYQTAMKRLGLMKAEMNSHHRLSNASISSLNSQQSLASFAEERSKRKPGPKKSVSFSDEVVLVASAEAEEEEHFPNPLLERILAKSNILSMNGYNPEMSTS